LSAFNVDNNNRNNLYLISTVLGSDRPSELTGAKIDSFRSSIWFRSAITIPNPNSISNPIPNPSQSEPNNFSLLSFRSPI